MSATGFKAGIAGVDNDDVVILMDNADHFDTFMFHITAGAADVFVTLDGTNWVGPVAMSDISDTSNDPVVVMASGKIYGLRGLFRAIRVMQNGATAVDASTMSYGHI